MTEPPRLASQPAGRGLLLAIAYVGFVSLGLPDPVAGVAWPSVRATFGLPQDAFGLVFLALGAGYCVSGFFGGRLTQALGLGNLLTLSSGLVAVAMVGTGLAPAWSAFVAWAVVWGLGSGGIDAGLNAMVARHDSARHVNWLHACYSAGATLGPLCMTATLLTAGDWRVGYHLVGGLLLAMTSLFGATRRRWDALAPPEADADRPPLGTVAALRSVPVWLLIALFLLYVGLEFMVGQWCFTLLTEGRGVRTDVAGLAAGGYYGSIGVGRVLAGAVAPRVGLGPLVRFALGTVVVGTLLLAFGTPAAVGLVGLIVVGLGLAPVFPCLMAATPARVGPDRAGHAVGFQVSAGMIGAATLPGLAGVLVEPFGLEAIAAFAVGLAVLLLAIHEVLLRASPASDKTDAIDAEDGSIVPSASDAKNES